MDGHFSKPLRTQETAQRLMLPETWLLRGSPVSPTRFGEVHLVSIMLHDTVTGVRSLSQNRDNREIIVRPENKTMR